MNDLHKPLLFMGILALLVTILNAVLYVVSGESVALLAACTNGFITLCALAGSRYVAWTWR